MSSMCGLFKGHIRIIIYTEITGVELNSILLNTVVLLLNICVNTEVTPTYSRGKINMTLQITLIL